MAQSRRLVISLLYLLTTLVVQAQDRSLQHEEAFTEGHYLLREESIYQEFPFELILIFPVKYTTRNQFIVPADFPGVDLEVIQGPTPRISHNELGNTLEYRYLLKAKRSGAIAIDSFALRTHEAYSRIAPFYIEVKSFLKADQTTPQLIWEGIPKQIYQGESFKAQLILTNVAKEWPILYTPELKAKGLIIEKISPYVQELEYEGKRSLRLGEWMFFAGEQGNFKIEPINLHINNLRFTSTEQKVSVIPLPKENKPEHFKTNAVGDLELHLLYDPPNQDNIVHLRVQLSGEGALHIIDLPSVTVDGMQLLQKEQLNLLKASDHGYSGVKEDNYLFLIDNYKDSKIELEPFSWFDPTSHKYHEKNLPQITFISTQIPFNPYLSLHVLAMDEVIGFNGDLHLRPYLIALSVWFVAIFILAFIYRPRKQQVLRFFSWHTPFLLFLLFLPMNKPDLSNDTLNQAQNALYERRWEEAIKLLHSMQSDPNYKNISGIIAYNLAVAYHHIDDLAKKRFYLLLALQKAPLSTIFQEAIEYENLKKFAQSRTLEHNLFVIVYWSSWLILLLFWMKIRQKPLTWRQNMIYLLLVSSTLILCLWFLHRPQTRVAVVKEEIRALRIPDKDATYGEYIHIGEVFHIGGRGRSYIQIKDGAGKEGWVEEDSIWIVKG